MLVVLHRLSQGSAGSPLSLSLMMHHSCYRFDCVRATDGVPYRYVGEVLEVHPKMQKLSDELKSLAEIDQICFYSSQLKVGKSTMTESSSCSAGFGEHVQVIVGH